MAIKKITHFVLLFLFLSVTSFGQRYAIMGALDQEINLLVETLQKKEKLQKGGIDFFTGELVGVPVVICKVGVGKVNAAYSTAVLTQNFDLKGLIFTGVAGGLHPEALPGDMVIGEAVLQYDLGRIDSSGHFTVWPFRKITGGNFTELAIPADKYLLELARKAADRVTFKTVAGRKPMVFTGIIGTSDLFVSNTEKAKWIFDEFGALATEMEGAAVGHVCRSIGLPFIVLRSCSDNANNQAQLSFSQFVGPASVNSSQLVLGMLREIGK